MPEQKTSGLAGVVAGETAICNIGEEGAGLSYRGYSIYDLTEYASFEEVAYLLIYGRLPDSEDLGEYKSRLISLRGLPEKIKLILEAIPSSAHPLEVLRTGCSALGSFEPETAERDQYYIADRLTACFPYMLLYWHHYHLDGSRISDETGEDDIAGHFLRLLSGSKPDELRRRALNVSLILYAEHEFNASTFSARITASTQADFYSCVTSGIGTLKGPLHGGANEQAMKLINSFRTPQEAERKVLEMLARREKIMGFGHRIYRHEDPRTYIIKEWSRKLSEASGDMTKYSISERIEEIMLREKKLYPNLDFYSATTYHFCGIPENMFTALFAMARVSGWSAHIIEQRKENRLIRPSAEYIGPGPQAYIPLERRR